MSVSLSIHPSIIQSSLIHSFSHPSIHQSIYPSIHPSTTRVSASSQCSMWVRAILTFALLVSPSRGGLPGDFCSSSTVIRKCSLFGVTVAASAAVDGPARREQREWSQLQRLRVLTGRPDWSVTFSGRRLQAQRRPAGGRCVGGGGRSGRRSGRRSVLEGVEVVDHVVADQRAAAEGPPVHHGDAERRMKVFVLRQLLNDHGSQSARGAETLQGHGG